MSVSQMLGHCNVPYEMVFTEKHPRPNAVVRFLLTMIAKNGVVSVKPYPKNSRTSPLFIIKEDRDFQLEKSRLIEYLKVVKELGEGYFNGLTSNSFGKLSTIEWNNLFYKHLDHHLRQFGV